MNSDKRYTARAMPHILKLLDLPRNKGETLLLIATSVIVLLPFVTYNPVWVNTIAALLVTWRVWITLFEQHAPKKSLLNLVTILLAAAIWLQFHTWIGRDGGIALLTFLVCLKLLEINSRRDAIAVIFVCYFLLVGQLLYSQSLLSALYLLFCLCILVGVQVSFQYHQLTPPFFKRLSNGFSIIGLAIPLSLVLFLLFPRFQGPLWGKPNNRLSHITGLSDSMEVGNLAELALSDQIAFRAKFDGPVPIATQLYWRAVVLDTFNGKRWSASSPNFSQHKPTSAVGARLVKQEIIMEPHNQRWLFGLDRPEQIINPSLVADEVKGELTDYWEMRSPSPLQERIRYTITSSVSSNSIIATSQDSASTAIQLKSLELPTGFNPLTLQWARQLREQHPNPKQLLQLVLSYFREQPFRYTLNPPPLGNNQIDDFIFDTRAGFCEHYASAFVVIMRAMNIPARVVTGYQGGEINPIDGLMTVRQSDSHAWAEIWIDSLGWLRVDPTAAVAPYRIERGFNASFPNRDFSDLMGLNQQAWLSNLMKSMHQQWDAMNSAWNLWVLNYNLSKQKHLFSSFTGIKNPHTLQLAIAMVVIAGLVAVSLALFFLSRPSQESPLDKLYNLFCQHMAMQGHARFPYEGSTDYGRRLQLTFQNNQELKEFLNLYTKCKYGRRYNVDINTLKALLKLCLQLKPSSNKASA